jgi:hypothetical protein
MLRVYGKQVRKRGGAEKVIRKEVKDALDKAPPPVKDLVEKVDSVRKDVFNETAARNFLLDNMPGLRNIVERPGTPSLDEDGGLRRRKRKNGETDEASIPGTPRTRSPEDTAGNSPAGSPGPIPRLNGDLLDISKLRRSASGRFGGALAELLPTKLIKEVLPPDIAGAFIPDEALLPADMDVGAYTITVLPSSSSDGVFSMGEPIKIQFAAPTKTVTRKDWVGIYRVNENLREKWTNRRSKNKWKWVTDSYEPLSDEQNGEISPKLAGLESEPATGTSTPSSPLDRYWYDEQLEQEMCGGTLNFEKGRIPWIEGIYEARYHHAGAYSVVTTSARFEVKGWLLARDFKLARSGTNVCFSQPRNSNNPTAQPKPSPHTS